MQVKILIPTVQDAAIFVTKMEEIPYNADLKLGSRSVDAKSLMGVLQLGVGRETFLEIYDGQDSDEIRKLLKDYIV